MNSDGVWFTTNWLSKQSKGLFLVFGCCGDEGHYVACDANSQVIFDSFHCRKYRLCFNSLIAIFSKGIDCVHELIIAPSLN